MLLGTATKPKKYLFSSSWASTSDQVSASGFHFGPRKSDFWPFIDFGHFPIEIPIEAEKFCGQQKEGSYIKNKNCFENGRPNGTTWNHVEVEAIKFLE